MKGRRKKRHQITCWCSAYDFPHRILGGKCDGSHWAEGQYLNKTHCQFCNLNTAYHCEAMIGIEDLKHGECFEREH